MATGAAKIKMADIFFKKNVHFCHLGQFFPTNVSWNIIIFIEVLAWDVGNAKQAKKMVGNNFPINYRPKLRGGKLSFFATFLS
jgi:hypothetical protein